MRVFGRQCIVTARVGSFGHVHRVCLRERRGVRARGAGRRAGLRQGAASPQRDRREHDGHRRLRQGRPVRREPPPHLPPAVEVGEHPPRDVAQPGRPLERRLRLAATRTSRRTARARARSRSAATSASTAISRSRSVSPSSSPTRASSAISTARARTRSASRIPRAISSSAFRSRARRAAASTSSASALNYAIFNQVRDDTKPTWVIGAESRFAIGQRLHACNDNAAHQVPRSREPHRPEP